MSAREVTIIVPEGPDSVIQTALDTMRREIVAGRKLRKQSPLVPDDNHVFLYCLFHSEGLCVLDKAKGAA